MGKFCVVAIPKDFKLEKILSIREQMGFCDKWATKYGVDVTIKDVNNKFDELMIFGEIAMYNREEGDKTNYYRDHWIYVSILFSLFEESGLLLSHIILDNSWTMIIINILYKDGDKKLKKIMEGKYYET